MQITKYYIGDLHFNISGDCWFIAAASNLAMTSRKLLERCVPPNQEFADDNYCGRYSFTAQDMFSNLKSLAT